MNNPKAETKSELYRVMKRSLSSEKVTVGGVKIVDEDEGEEEAMSRSGFDGDKLEDICSGWYL